MSIRWITKVWDSSPYDGTKLLIHLALADISHEDGRFFASQKDLAEKGRCSVEYVRKVINEMVESGFIRIITKGSSRGKATVYQLLPLKLPNAEGGLEVELPNSDAPTPQLHSVTSVLPTRPIKDPQEDSAISDVCFYLAKAIELRGLKGRPNETVINGSRWRSEARLLLAGRIGHKDTSEACGTLTVSQIKAAIDYAMNDDFWATVIFSPAALRRDYPRLRAQYLAAAQKKPRGSLPASNNPVTPPPPHKEFDFGDYIGCYACGMKWPCEVERVRLGA